METRSAASARLMAANHRDFILIPAIIVRAGECAHASAEMGGKRETCAWSGGSAYRVRLVAACGAVWRGRAGRAGTVDMKRNPIIVALDVESAEEARQLIERLGPQVNFYKIGMELYAAAGMEFVREVLGMGKDVFLDMKYYDIPETVKRAVAQVAKVGVRFLTIHGSAAIMRAAVAGKGDSNLKLLAVTVLTSFNEQDLADLGYQGDVGALVELRARKAIDAGMDGLVASPLEAARLRALAGPGAILVTPGVRSAGSAVGDQKRVATPAEAVRDGADYLVMGRQITRSKDPAAEAARVLAELAEC